MYTEFYNLKEKPFNLTPSPRFLYLSEGHKEALSLLHYGITERKGFILLTGEVGTGKTTIIHALLEGLDEGVRYIYLSNPLLSPADFMNYLAFSTLKRKEPFQSKADFILEFEAFLRDALQHQKVFLLIIDESQKLSFDLLEEIRLLSNMETGEQKLINIFLVGQPELNEKLSEPRCRPLLQRISVRHHIAPLSLEETAEYLYTRLRVAGAKDGEGLFGKGVIKAIHSYSGGFPRMVNVLADNALLLGYAAGRRKITPDIVRECYDDLKLDGTFAQGGWQRPQSAPAPEAPADPRPTRAGRKRWALAAAIVLLILAAGAALSQRGRHFLEQALRYGQVTLREPPTAPVTPSPAEQPEEKASPTGGGEEQPQVREEIAPPAQENPLDTDLSPEAAPPDPKPIEDLALKEPETRYEKVTVRPGDTLLLMATKVYGRADENTLERIKEHNPGLTDINRIEVGQEILFPLTDEPRQGPIFTVHIASYQPFDEARDLFQKLSNEGQEAYIIPTFNPEKGNVFRVTLGNFKTRQEADFFAAALLRKGIAGHAQTIEVEMK